MASNNDVVLTRIIDAPLQRVWRAWTTQSAVQEWWGPWGATNPTCEWQAKPGGKINIVMLAGKELGPLAGQEWPMAGQFQTVEDQKRLVFITSAISRDKSILDTLVTVSFEAKGDKTKLTVQIEVTKAGPEAAGALQGMNQGWNQQLDKLVKYAKGASDE